MTNISRSKVLEWLRARINSHRKVGTTSGVGVFSAFSDQKEMSSEVSPIPLRSYWSLEESHHCIEK